jgi:hypothetical protein
MKKKFVIFTVIISLLLLPLLSNADSTVDSKATALNKLTLLQGDGVNFNLDGQLKRSEAVTFIVRIMGKEALVKANTDKYNKTTFTDVKSTDWFAAYVGYCQENKILNGFPDGGFHPNDSISEKAFLKLVLGALGYLDEQDFVWDTIYESSFNLGLVTDVKYKTQTEDNTKYVRSDVVNVLYGSLTNSIKGLKKTIIESLIEANVVDRTIAIQLGLVKEIASATIDSVTVANNVTLSVKLSKTVNKLADNNIVIYETDNKATVLKSSVTSQVYSDLLINTSIQIPDKKYTIEITSTVDGADKPSVATSNFIGYKIAEVKSNYFKISKVVPVSKNVINVFFTQPVTNDMALPIYYEITKNNDSFVKGSINNMIVKVLPSQNNVVSLYLKNATIIDDAAYSLKISGDIISAYGVQLNDGLGESSIFAKNSQNNVVLKVDSLYILDSKTIRVQFNKEIDQVLAKQLNNYQISSNTGTPNVITKVTIPSDGFGKALNLTVGIPLDKTLSYQLIMNSMNDIYGIDSLSDTTSPFVGKPLTDLKDLKVTLVTVIDKSTIQVYFDKRIDATTALNTGYYTLNGITDPNYIAFPFKVYVNPLDTTSVKIYLPVGKELVGTSIYRLKVASSMTDELGNASLADAIFNFTGSSNVSIKPLIIEAMVIGKDTVKIKSSKELSLTGANIALSNYSLELKEGKNTTTLKTPTSIIAYDESTLIVHFDNLDFTKNYSFKFNTLTDYAGLNVRSSADGSTSILLKNGDTP